MTFSEALDAVLANLKIARAEWKETDMHIPIEAYFSLEGTAFEPCICMKTTDGKVWKCLPSQADMQAKDWEVVE